MHDRHVAYLPTLTAVEATETYFNHYVAGATPETPKIVESHKAFRPLAQGLQWQATACLRDVVPFACAQ